MPDFSNALQGYENGANNAVRVGAERLAIKTPVQSFLDVLHQRQEMGLQQQQIQALGGYRQGMLENAANRNDTTAQHFQDMAQANQQKADLGDRKLNALTDFRTKELALRGLTAQAQAGNLDARSKLAAAQQALTESKTNLIDTWGGAEAEAKIGNLNAQAQLLGTKDTNAQGPSDSAIIKQYQADQKAWSILPPSKRGAPPTLSDAALKLKAAMAAVQPAEKDSMNLMEPDAYMQTPTNSNNKLNQEAPPSIQQVPPTPAMPPISAQLPQVVPPGQPNPLEALLKVRRPLDLKRGDGGITPTGPPPAPGPYPPQPNMKPEYPIDASGSPKPGYVAPLGQSASLTPAQPVSGMQQPPMSAMLDPLHGQTSQREPGVYTLNGKQYLVDGSGMIQALPT